MKRFYCGFEKEKFYRTRKGLRKHLREDHHIKNNFKNKKIAGGNIIIQSWWKEEEFK